MDACADRRFWVCLFTFRIRAVPLRDIVGMMKMAKIQLGHQLYIYQLIAKEYGTGHQIFLPKIE